MVIEQLLRGLHDFLREKGVLFYVMFGTLLGARRDGAIIPWTSDLDVVVEAEFTHVLERIHEWNETFYFWMENKHIGRMCIVDNDDGNGKTWGAWDKIPTYVDVYVPKHIAKNVARASEGKTVFPVVPRCVFNTVGSDRRSAKGPRVGLARAYRLVATRRRRGTLLLRR